MSGIDREIIPDARLSLIDQYQSTIANPETRENSRALWVTSVA